MRHVSICLLKRGTGKNRAYNPGDSLSAEVGLYGVVANPIPSPIVSASDRIATVNPLRSSSCGTIASHSYSCSLPSIPSSTKPLTCERLQYFSTLVPPARLIEALQLDLVARAAPTAGSDE